MGALAESKKFLERKAERERLANRESWEHARKDSEQIIDMIRTRYQPDRIWQWGSLLHPEQFNSRSDIDIALEGIVEAETFFALLGDAMEMTSFSLDIIQLEKIEPEFRQLIQLKGKLIYERS